MFMKSCVLMRFMQMYHARYIMQGRPLRCVVSVGGLAPIVYVDWYSACQTVNGSVSDRESYWELDQCMWQQWACSGYVRYHMHPGLSGSLKFELCALPNFAYNLGEFWIHSEQHFPGIRR